MRQVPLTLLFGFLDAGKSTVLNHLLSHSESLNLAGLTHDAWISHGSAGGDGQATLAPEASAGAQAAIRYAIPDALRTEMNRLVQEENAEGLVFEAHGLAEPQGVVEAFFSDSANADFLFLDTVVTVVDAGRFLEDIYSAETLQQRGMAGDEADVRSIAEVLIHQVEFANVIVLNKMDTIPQVEQERLVAALQLLNPQAEILPVKYGAVPCEKGIATGLFDFDQTSTAAGWLQAMRSEEETASLGYGVGRFVYRSRRPFHSGRFYLFLRM
ncbi:MAG TPA: GTP-binding protein, partial [Rhodothermales bacterium]|nr:GTP-binding protein [Rhodothermales bacterium]